MSDQTSESKTWDNGSPPGTPQKCKDTELERIRTSVNTLTLTLRLRPVSVLSTGEQQSCRLIHGRAFFGSGSLLAVTLETEHLFDDP